MARAKKKEEMEQKSVPVALGVEVEADTSMEWIHLTTAKQFSRLLYTNPVCFLCTIDRSRTDDSQQPNTDAIRNVMVLSWLTPTNNDGEFIFSISKYRHSASLLVTNDTDGKHILGVEFSLCVPIRGMEQMVLDVGSISGQNRSKFSSLQECEKKNGDEYSEFQLKLSKRKTKKIKRQQFSENGVPGLVSVPLGLCPPCDLPDKKQASSDLFAIHGTVAHLHCRTSGIMNSDQNQQHFLVSAKIVDAYVERSYWDVEKQLFCPQKPNVLPYLTFFGSQTFGYVTAPAKK